LPVYILNVSVKFAKSRASISFDIPDMIVLSSIMEPPVRPAAASHWVDDALEARSIDIAPTDMTLDVRGPLRPTDPEFPDRMDLAAASSMSESSASMIALQLSLSVILFTSGKLWDRTKDPETLRNELLRPLIPNADGLNPGLVKLLNRMLGSRFEVDDLRDIFIKVLALKSPGALPNNPDESESLIPEIVLMVLSELRTVPA
jgi:hypothetical protein